MSTTSPIRKEEDLQRFRNYYLEKRKDEKLLINSGWIEHSAAHWRCIEFAVERCL